ncbi:hypothetical protein RAS1_14090 [Phycisphaerae bacterium RAS1]|nr:hypothetical protein RAS1_14090 [Phycisphaerae bacterium RAS1]
MIRRAINKREQADNQRDGVRYRACARFLSSKDLRARIREQARSTAGTRMRAGAHAGWRSRNQRACPRLLRCARSSASARTSAGGRLGFFRQRFLPGRNSPEGTREHGPASIEFIQSVRREGLLHGNPRRMGESRQATLWSVRGRDEADPALAEPMGENGGVHDQGLGQPELPAADAPPETGGAASELEGVLPAGSTVLEHGGKTACQGNMGILGGAAWRDALSIRPQERQGAPLGFLRPRDLTRLLNSTPLGEVISERQLHRHRERAAHRFVFNRQINLVAYIAWLECERHAPPSRLELPGRHRAICTRDLLDLLHAHRYRCALSGRVLEPANAAMDHVLPVSRGGRHSIENIQLLEKAVNRAKGTMTNEEFIAMCREVVVWMDSRREGGT